MNIPVCPKIRLKRVRTQKMWVCEKGRDGRETNLDRQSVRVR